MVRKTKSMNKKLIMVYNIIKGVNENDKEINI